MAFKKKLLFALAVHLALLLFEALRHKKAIGRNAQGGVVVKAAPAATFVMPQPEVLLEALVVALDAPAQVCHAHQFQQ